jgi:translation initiation factor 5A
MAFKLIDAKDMRVGTFIMVENDAYSVKSMDVSKTGKHGHAKVRFEALSLTGGKKKVLVVPGHERFEVPMIDKRKAQVLSVAGENASLMDSESFENFELPISGSLKDEIKDGISIEYWDIEGKKIIKKVL